jgi:hypothetical protein
MLNLHALTTVNPTADRGLVAFSRHFAGARAQLLGVLLTAAAVLAHVVTGTISTALGAFALALALFMVVVFLGNRNLVSVNHSVISDLVELHNVMDPDSEADWRQFNALQSAAIELTRRLHFPKPQRSAEADLFTLRCRIATELTLRATPATPDVPAPALATYPI